MTTDRDVIAAPPDRTRLPIALYPALLAATLVARTAQRVGREPVRRRPGHAPGCRRGHLPRVARADPPRRPGSRRRLRSAVGPCAPRRARTCASRWVIVLATGLLLAERYLLPAARRTIRWPRIGPDRFTPDGRVDDRGRHPGRPAGRRRQHRACHHPRDAPAPGHVAGRVDVDRSRHLHAPARRPCARRRALERLRAGRDAVRRARSRRTGSRSPRSRGPTTRRPARRSSSMFSQAQLDDIPRMAGLLEQRDARPPGGIVRDVDQRQRDVAVPARPRVRDRRGLLGLRAGRGSRGRPLRRHGAAQRVRDRLS